MDTNRVHAMVMMVVRRMADNSFEPEQIYIENLNWKQYLFEDLEKTYKNIHFL
jgi:hypothetical protein